MPKLWARTTEHEIQIVVHTTSRAKHTLDVEGNFTTAATKEELQRRSGNFTVQQQCLVYKGQNLVNQTTIKAVGIQAGDVLHMALGFIAGSE
jgi:hypothetical protein